MTSSRELQVRILDDPKKSLEQNAKDISAKVGLKQSTCRNYLCAERNGYESCEEYFQSLASKRGGSSKNEYRGYVSLRKKFEDSMIQFGLPILFTENPCNPLEQIMKEEIQEKLIQKLKKVYRTLSKKKRGAIKWTLKGKTFEEIGAIIGSKRQDAHRYYWKAIGRMRLEVYDFLLENELVQN